MLTADGEGETASRDEEIVIVGVPSTVLEDGAEMMGEKDGGEDTDIVEGRSDGGGDTDIVEGGESTGGCGRGCCCLRHRGRYDVCAACNDR